MGNQQGEHQVPNIIYNAKIGDGSITKNGINHYMSFTSTALDYLHYKRALAEPYGLSRLYDRTSGYGGRKPIKAFCTHNHADITAVANTPLVEVVRLLSISDLVLLYLDDGSWHKNKNHMHIYCNSFSVEETETLADRILYLIGGKRCTLRWDKKKDGRKFPYLYLPTNTSNILRVPVAEFLYKNCLSSLLYKVDNLELPSETIETTRVQPLEWSRVHLM